jgi:hypothetical protein
LTSKWISMSKENPPIGKPVLCYFVVKRKSMAATIMEDAIIRYGAYDGKNSFSETRDMGKYIRGYGSFSSDNVTYWADVDPIKMQDISL